MKWKIACIQMDIAFGNPEENNDTLSNNVGCSVKT